MKSTSSNGSGGVPITRRSFAAGGIAVASMLVLGGIGKVAPAAEVPIRPPGAQDEDRLLALCIKCNRCVGACPHDAITLLAVESGVQETRTPALRFDRGYCDFCAQEGQHLCAADCPTQAISPDFDPAVEKIGIARVNTDECLLYRSGSGRCSYQCMNACPYGAIEAGSNGGLFIDESLCNGCGACEYACPSSSYGRYTGSNKRGVTIVALEGSGQ